MVPSDSVATSHQCLRTYFSGLPCRHFPVSRHDRKTAVRQIVRPCHTNFRGRCQDNIFVERLWWTVKHHYLYLHSFGCGSDLRQGLIEWVRYYNHERGHSSLDDRTPDEVYYGLPHPFADAA
jgi:transposase InsO family protein